jgi:hypothetical protein
MLYSMVMLAALCSGAMTGLMISQARPIFVSPGAMRELTGLNVLGTVSMNWTPSEQRRRRRGQLVLGLSFLTLLLAYGAVLASSILGT